MSTPPELPISAFRLVVDGEVVVSGQQAVLVYAFVQQEVKKEREACARLCEKLIPLAHEGSHPARMAAKLIRSRT